MEGYIMSNRIPDESTRDKIQVMTAYLVKRDIQVKIKEGSLLSLRYGEGWHDVVSEPEWNWKMCTWRIKPEGVSVDELVEKLKEFDGDLRVNLNFEDQNFDIDAICQDGGILDIFPENVGRG